MKAKYSHYGNECIIYHHIICVDNIFVSATTYQGSWCSMESDSVIKVCLTNAEARRMFYTACIECEKENYDCIYKEVR
jgi:hypothetical protein